MRKQQRGRCLQRKEQTHKKGMAIMPICFGISFTNTPMNHARALVHVYQDGSVGVSTGGVEMGQGLNTKMVQVAAEVFSIDPSRVKLESTNTTRVANTSPSAASATADLNGKGAGDRLQRDPRAHQGESIADAEEQAGSNHHRQRSRC
jgi:xanthine dehydrogenase large subunit